MSDSTSKEPTEIHDEPNAAKSVPLRPGLLGLQPKKRTQSSNAQGASSDQSSSTIAVGQQVLQSLASLSSSTGSNPSNQVVPREMPQTLAPRTEGPKLQKPA